MTVFAFFLVAVGSLTIASGQLESGSVTLFYMTIASTSAAVFALRGLYFAIMEEANIPLPATGTAVGIVSAIGFTPDIFVGPVMGHLLDRSPGPQGHQHLFVMLASFAVIGAVAACLIARKGSGRVVTG